MRKIKFKNLFRFQAGKNISQEIYCGLLRSALDYKYRNRDSPVEMTEQELFANPVFEFKESDKIHLNRTSTLINGQRLRELFVTTIFAKYLDNLEYYDNHRVKDNMVFIGYTETDTGTDTAIFITKNALLVQDGNYFFRAIAGKSSLCLYIQVKEYYQYKDFQQKIIYPKSFDINNLNVDKLKSYDELILVYIRSFCNLNFNEIKKDLKKNGLSDKHIILIGTEALGGEIPREYCFWDFKKDEVYTTPITPCNLFQTN